MTKQYSVYTGLGVVVSRGADASAIEDAAFASIARGDYVVTLDQATYDITRMINLPGDVTLRSDGAFLIATTPNPIVNMTNGGSIEGINFRSNVPGATGISGNLVRSTVSCCTFWTSLSIGIDCHGLLSRITRCMFGYSGPTPKQFQALRIRSSNSSSNAWEIDRNGFYGAAGDCGVEIGDGYQLDFHHNNVERNNSNVAVKIAGMLSVDIHHNWFERNAGVNQVDLIHDVTNTIGNNSTSSHHNWWNLNHPENKYVYNTYGACRVYAESETGTAWNGMDFSADMTKVVVGLNNWRIGKDDVV